MICQEPPFQSDAKYVETPSHATFRLALLANRTDTRSDTTKRAAVLIALMPLCRAAAARPSA